MANTQRNFTRHGARKKALQSLYQWELSGQNIGEILGQFEQFQDMAKVDVEYFTQLFRGVPGDCQALDEHIEAHIDRKIDELDPIERNALRICCFELINNIEIPYKVLINEAVELTKIFGAEQGHKFVNGVADKLAQQLRPHEPR